MEKFTFKGGGFDLECSFTPNVNFKEQDVTPENIKISTIISVPECYKHLGADEILPIVEHFYGEDLYESAYESIDPDDFLL